MRKGWNTENISEALLEVVREAELDHFPTHSELTMVTGNRALAVAVSKHGGTQFYADLLKMPIKDCESKLGNKYEIKGINDIEAYAGVKAEAMPVRHPYDILTEGNVKIDVKISKGFKLNSGITNFTCNLEKKYPTCDFFLIYCVLDESIVKTLIVPATELMGKTQIGIGLKSGWDVYIDAWELIAKQSEFNMRLKREKPKRPRSVVNA